MALTPEERDLLIQTVKFEIFSELEDEIDMILMNCNDEIDAHTALQELSAACCRRWARYQKSPED